MRRFFIAFVPVVVALATGCTAEAEGPSESKQVIEGKVPVSSTGTRAWVGVSGAGRTHVIAHALGKKGDATTKVDVDVRPDGSFHLEVQKGARYVVEIADGSQHVALYLGNGQMLEASGSAARVKVSPVRTSGIQPYAARIIES